MEELDNAEVDPIADATMSAAEKRRAKRLRQRERKKEERTAQAAAEAVRSAPVSVPAVLWRDWLLLPPGGRNALNPDAEYSRRFGRDMVKEAAAAAAEDEATAREREIGAAVGGALHGGAGGQQAQGGAGPNMDVDVVARRRYLGLTRKQARRLQRQERHQRKRGKLSGAAASQRAYAGASHAGAGRSTVFCTVPARLPPPPSFGAGGVSMQGLGPEAAGGRVLDGSERAAQAMRVLVSRKQASIYGASSSSSLESGSDPPIMLSAQSLSPAPRCSIVYSPGYAAQQRAFEAAVATYDIRAVAAQV